MNAVSAIFRVTFSMFASSRHPGRCCVVRPLKLILVSLTLYQSVWMYLRRSVCVRERKKGKFAT